VTSAWITVVVAILSGVAASFISTWVGGQHERRSWLRSQLVSAGTDFSRSVQLAFGPVQEVILLRFDEPKELDETGERDSSLELDQSDDEDVDLEDAPDPLEYWSQRTIAAYNSAKAAVLHAEAARTPLFLLLPEDSVTILAANRAISMLGSAVGALREIPRDSKTISDLYLLQAQIEWHAFNDALRRELPRAGRLARWRRTRERLQYQAWGEEKFRKRTHKIDGETRVLA
jgi:type II secretory pathway pseudopilin PulG